MKVFAEPFQLKLPRDGTRSVGVHLSQILRSYALMIGVLDKKFDTPLDDTNSAMAIIGIAWEDHLAKHQMPGVEFHPGELSLDGIAMSPDGISIETDEEYVRLVGIEPGSWIVHEIKSTRKSSRDFKESLRLKADKVKLWLWQIMGYRHALNSMLDPELRNNVAILHCMFLNGNYSKDFDDPESGPTQKKFRLVFSDEELADNWLMITSHRDYMAENELLRDYD